VCNLNGMYALIGRSCGVSEIVPLDCGDPLCPDCEKRRSKERRAHWSPVFEAMRNPRMLTLTIKNGVDLKERIGVLQASFRKLLDFRYGARNLSLVADQAGPFLQAHYAALVAEGTLTEVEAAQRVADFEKSIKRFTGTVNKYKRNNDKWPRMRDLVGKGFATLEITCSQAEECWHVHRHLCIDGFYIPWPLLACVWRIVTRDEGLIVDIRPMDNTYSKSINEVTKYLAKAWDIPAGKKDEFRAAVRGLKRIWPLGGAKPVIVDRICPYCNEPTCRGHLLDQGEAYQRGTLADIEVVALRCLSDESVKIFILDREKGWRNAPLDLIPKDFAWHSLKEHAP
jgi:hypothetical protein